MAGTNSAERPPRSRDAVLWRLAICLLFCGIALGFPGFAQRSFAVEPEVLAQAGHEASVHAEAMQKKKGEFEGVTNSTATVTNKPKSSPSASAIPLTRQFILAAPRLPDVDPNLDPKEAIRRRKLEQERIARRERLVPGSSTNSIVSTSTNVFEVNGYELLGNTLLPPDVTELVLQPYIGPKISFDLIRHGLSDLRTVYLDRGYITVTVGLPQQTLSNGIVKVQIFEGVLTQIVIKNNHHFSSNNVMRALPSLRTNTFINKNVFQAELDRANANQDRQIYPQIEPGPEENTTAILLDVKDRLPLHAKAEFNNYSSPGTPSQRVNTSAAYNNLWQRDHSFGVQYGFSPETYKEGNKWNFYDLPLVANYGAFYRLPLGNPQPLAEAVAQDSSRFGYDEATHQFRLPPSTGEAETTFYASRSTIDTGTQSLNRSVLYNVPGVRQVSREDLQQDITVNEAIGWRLTEPLPDFEGIHSTFSGGLDFKHYLLDSRKTNNFTFTEITVDASGNPNPPIVSTVSSPVPARPTGLDYLPISLNYSGIWRRPRLTTSFGLGLSANTWFSGSLNDLQALTGSRKSSGNWVTLTPNLTAEIVVKTNWNLVARANGQWASEPLISNEQFGAGGIGSVRGYHEGEVFGDTGWHVSLEQQTPPHVIGLAYDREALVVRASFYMDYAQTYLLDPNGRQGQINLWSAGVGAIVAVGPHWEARLLFSLPFERTFTTPPGQPVFNFALTAQF